MGWFSKLKKIVNVVTLGQSGLIEKEIEIGGRVLKATIDVNDMVVRIGEDVFRSVPGEVFMPGLGPLAGLLKNEVEDELILLNPLGIVPSVWPVVNGALVIGRMIGVVDYRKMLPDELTLARKVFGGSLDGLDDIRLCNLVGLDGDPFTAPMYPGGALIALGDKYDHDDPVDDRVLLAHELTHVWQLQRARLVEVQVCKGLLSAAADNVGIDQYDYTPGTQWSSYGLEQQAEIVEDWVRRSGPNNIEMRLASQLFRYINGNVRTADNGARTAGDGGVRSLFSESRSHSVRELLVPSFSVPRPPRPPRPPSRPRPPGTEEP
jgi:hypothetical protein